MRAARRIAAALLSLTLSHAAHAQDMIGIRIGEALPRDLPPAETIRTDGDLILETRRTEEGLGLTVLLNQADERVLYLELRADITGEPVDAPVSGMAFATTTRGDILQRFGSSGLVYEELEFGTTFRSNPPFHATYEISGTGGVISFVTEAPDPSVPTFVTEMVLSAIILADAAFLDARWGPAHEPGGQDYMQIPDPTF